MEGGLIHDDNITNDDNLTIERSLICDNNIIHDDNLTVGRSLIQQIKYIKYI